MAINICRCKFRVISRTETTGGWELYAVPVGGGSPGEENNKFFEATPDGELKLQVVKGDIAERFNPGDEFYIDLVTGNV